MGISECERNGANRKAEKSGYPQCDERKEIGELILDHSVPMEERVFKLFGQEEIPCCFRAGDLMVDLEFSPDGPGIQEIFDGYLRRKKSGIG